MPFGNTFPVGSCQNTATPQDHPTSDLRILQQHVHVSKECSSWNLPFLSTLKLCAHTQKIPDLKVSQETESLNACIPHLSLILD